MDVHDAEATPERTYEPLDPRLRPRKERQTVRVVLIDDAERTLLFEDSDPGVPGTTWWMTPGGGVDPGESFPATAVREVAEETGYVLTESDLIGPVARRHVVHGYSDLVVEQDEVFYLARVRSFDVDVAAHTADEQLTILQHRWFSHDELRTTVEHVWPAVLVELWDLADDEALWPVDLGVQEESTVPDVL